MADFTEISDEVLSEEKPLTQTTMRQFRDNDIWLKNRWKAASGVADTNNTTRYATLDDTEDYTDTIIMFSLGGFVEGVHTTPNLINISTTPLLIHTDTGLDIYLFARVSDGALRLQITTTIDWESSLRLDWTVPMEPASAFNWD
jgi:hypothetical protein